jgi:hypothetical protein
MAHETPLHCPYCASTHFSELAPPYGPLSVIRCAGCLRSMALKELAPPPVPRERLTVENAAPHA